MKSPNKNKIHSSWLVAWASIGTLVGIAAVGLLPSRLHGLAWLVLALGLVCLAFFNSRNAGLLIAIIAGLILGLYRGSAAMQDLSGYKVYFGREVVLVGQLSEDASQSSSGQQRLKLKNVIVEGNNLPGEIWVSLKTVSQVKRSDKVILSGTISEGFGNFAASMYGADLQEIIRSGHVDPARDVRDWFADKIRLSIPEPQASLGIGFLVGQKSSLPEEILKNLQILGLTHIIVASGYNLTILVRLTRKTFARVSKYMATVSALGLTACFVAVTGFSPSMTRASLITTISLLAWYFGRSVHPFVLLSFVAGITAFINPSYVWGDLGWYLSFAAFGGVIVLSPLLLAYFWGSKKPGSIMQIVMETTSAQIMTLPIIAIAFGQVALLAIPANVAILPFIPITMLLTFVAGVGAIVAPVVAHVFGWPAGSLLGYMTKMSDWLSGLPLAMQEFGFNTLTIVFYYALVLLGIILLKRATKHKFIDDNIVV